MPSGTAEEFVTIDRDGHFAVFMPSDTFLIDQSGFSLWLIGAMRCISCGWRFCPRCSGRAWAVLQSSIRHIQSVVSLISSSNMSPILAQDT
jgi:hypothetical protein